MISDALQHKAPQGLEVIAEPGRYYVESAYTLATAIHGIRNSEYYINDGVYGSFNCVLYDHASPQPVALKVSLPPANSHLTPYIYLNIIVLS